MRYLLIIFIVMIGQSFAHASPTQTEIENRAREVGKALRCVVCQNQSIEESDASLATDMRTLVRARLKAGDSNEEVIAYMQNRYGDFVLLKPPVQKNTYVLWFLPFLLVLIGIFWFYRRSSSTRKNDIIPLSPEETKALSELE